MKQQIEVVLDKLISNENRRLKIKERLQWYKYKIVSDQFYSLQIPINGFRPKNCYYITISTSQQDGVKNEVVQVENINKFIADHEGKIKIKRYGPNKSNDFDILFATRSEQLGGSGNKADVVLYGHEINETKEKPIMWLSLKAGSSEQDFQQYFDISNTTLDNMSSLNGYTTITDFLKCCEILFKNTRNKESFEVMTNTPLTDSVSKYAIYGSEYKESFDKESFGPQNVNYLIQGDVKFEFDKNANAYEISGAHVLRHAEVPTDEAYAPKLLLRRDSYHSIAGIKQSRLFIVPNGYHKKKKEPDVLKLLNRKFRYNPQPETLEAFLKRHEEEMKKNNTDTAISS